MPANTKTISDEDMEKVGRNIKLAALAVFFNAMLWASERERW